MKKAIVVSGWFLTASLSLFVSITTIHLLVKPRPVGLVAQANYQSESQPVLAYKQFVHSIFGSSHQITTGDARPILIAKFLEHHNSPLKPYDHFGLFFTQTADKYGLDYRLLPAIAMQESNLCKAIPTGSFNCLGLGVHSQGTWHFESYEANFDKAAEILKKNYISQGLVTPEQIQTKYTPSSNGSWQYAVNQFMDRIETGYYQ